MIVDLLTYLLKNMASLEVEGIRSRTDTFVDEFFNRMDMEKERMIRPVIEEFFFRLELQKELALKQFAKLSVFMTGIFLTAVGAAFIIDELVQFRGAGFVAVGLVVLVASFFMNR